MDRLQKPEDLRPLRSLVEIVDDKTDRNRETAWWGSLTAADFVTAGDSQTKLLPLTVTDD